MDRFKYDIEFVNGGDACIERNPDNAAFINIVPLKDLFPNGDYIMDKLIESGSLTLKNSASDPILQNEEVIGFVVHDVNNTTRVGRLDWGLDTSIWYEKPGEISYYNAFHGSNKNGYGSITKTPDQTKYGPSVLLTDELGSRYVYIYIGIINTIICIKILSYN